jgi:hypothetical protein
MAADAAPGFPAFSSTMDVAVEADAPLAVGEFFTQLLQARRDGALPADVQGVFSAGAVRILELKAAHRQLCESTDALREAAGEAKSQLDQSSLQLQNLLYERQHYEKEIASCRGWQSAYRDEQVRWAAAATLPGRSAHSLGLLSKPKAVSDSACRRRPGAERSAGSAAQPACSAPPPSPLSALAPASLPACLPPVAADRSGAAGGVCGAPRGSGGPAG